MHSNKVLALFHVCLLCLARYDDVSFCSLFPYHVTAHRLLSLPLSMWHSFFYCLNKLSVQNSVWTISLKHDTTNQNLTGTWSIRTTHRQPNALLSGVARAFPGERTAHPEDQIKSRREWKKMRENERNCRKIGKSWGNALIVATREWEADYGPTLLSWICIVV